MDGGAWWAAVHGVTKSRTRLSDFTFTFHFEALEKEMANPLHCSCLENPRDRGAWWYAICGVAQSRTQLKRLSSRSSGSSLIFTLVIFDMTDRGTPHEQLIFPTWAMFYNQPQLSDTCFTNLDNQKKLRWESRFENLAWIMVESHKTWVISLLIKIFFLLHQKFQVFSTTVYKIDKQGSTVEYRGLFSISYNNL